MKLRHFQEKNISFLKTPAGRRQPVAAGFSTGGWPKNTGWRLETGCLRVCFRHDYSSILCKIRKKRDKIRSLSITCSHIDISILIRYAISESLVKICATKLKCHSFFMYFSNRAVFPSRNKKRCWKSKIWLRYTPNF